MGEKEEEEEGEEGEKQVAAATPSVIDNHQPEMIILKFINMNILTITAVLMT